MMKQGHQIRQTWTTVIILVLLYCISVCECSWGAQPTDSWRAEVDAAFNRVDKLLEQFEYDEAAGILEEMLIKALPLEAKIEINTKLATVYEQNRYEQKAVDCLLENLRNFPSYKLPNSLQAQLQHLYTRALEAYQKERKELNNPPVFTNLPRFKEIKIGEQLEFDVTATDPDGDSLTISVRQEPGVAFNYWGNGSGKFVYVPPRDSRRPEVSVWFYVNDGLITDSASLTISILAETGPTHADLIRRSLVVPGRGQYTSGRRKVGTALFVAQLVTVGASVGLTLSYNRAVDDYNSSFAGYSSASNSEQLIVTLNDAHKKYKSVSDKEKTRNIAYAATAAAYLINILDVIISKPESQPPNAQEDAGLDAGWRAELKVNPGGVFLGLKW